LIAAGDRDLGSSNGTLLNGSRVTEYVLRDGDKLMLGETTFVFRIEQAKKADGSAG